MHPGPNGKVPSVVQFMGVLGGWGGGMFFDMFVLLDGWEFIT